MIAERSLLYTAEEMKLELTIVKDNGRYLSVYSPTLNNADLKIILLLTVHQTSNCVQNVLSLDMNIGTTKNVGHNTCLDIREMKIHFIICREL